MVLCCFLPGHVGQACSALGSSVEFPGFLAGNYDWHARGGLVYLSPRGQIKNSLDLGTNQRSVQWTSKLASLTISQFGRDYPMQGLNEAGLGGMVLAGAAEYPAEGQLGVLQEHHWLQYQLDHYRTIQEVVAHVNDFGIEKLSANLHWFLCDATGDCAAIEFLKGKAWVYRGQDLPIRGLTNTPYTSAMTSFRSWLESERVLPQGYASVSRFIRIGASRQSGGPVDLATVLDQVALHGFTAWQSVFDLGAKKVRVRLEGGDWFEFDFRGFDTGCSDKEFMADLTTGQWKAYDHGRIESLFSAAAQGAEGLGPERRALILSSSRQMRCE